MSIKGFFMGLGGMLLLNLALMMFTDTFGFPLDAGGRIGSGSPFLALAFDGLVAIVVGVVVGCYVYISEA